MRAAGSSGFFAIALSRPVVARAVRVALLVGTLLALINHGDAILRLSLDTGNLVKILLTFLVPDGVSTHASVRAIQSENRNRG